MLAGKTSETLVNNISEVALAINSRAGTFGYGRAAEVAYKLYLFCRNQLKPDNPATKPSFRNISKCCRSSSATTCVGWAAGKVRGKIANGITQSRS